MEKDVKDVAATTETAIDSATPAANSANSANSEDVNSKVAKYTGILSSISVHERSVSLAYRLSSAIKMIADNGDIKDTRLGFVTWFDILRCLAEKPKFALVERALVARTPEGDLDKSKPSDYAKQFILPELVLHMSQVVYEPSQTPVHPVTGKEEDEAVNRTTIRTYLHAVDFTDAALANWNLLLQKAAEKAAAAAANAFD